MTRRGVLGVLVGLASLHLSAAEHTPSAGATAPPTNTPPLAEYVGAISFDLVEHALSPDGTARSPNDPWPVGAAAGVAVAADGTLYVIDSRANHLLVFDRDGASMQTWGEGGEGPGQFRFEASSYYWGDLAIGPNGQLFIVDPFNSRIQVWNQDGTYLRAWGERGSRDGQFDRPSGIGIDGAGHVYVTETGNRRLQIFDPEGRFLAVWNPSPEDGGPFRNPSDVAIDAAGIVAVTDYDQNLVFRFTPEGDVIDRLGAPRGGPGFVSKPWGIATDAAGHLFVATSQQIHVFDRDGGALGVIDGVAETPDQSMLLLYLTVGPDNLLYVADEPNRRVQVFRLLPPLTDPPVGEG